MVSIKILITRLASASQRRGVSAFLILAFSSSALSGEENGTLVSLSEVISIALKNNPSLQEAAESLRVSQARVKKSRAGLLPQADFQFAYSRLDPGSVRRGNVFVEPGRALVEAFGTGDPNDVRPTAYSNNFSTSIQIVQPLYNGGANWATLSMAQAETDGREKSYDDVRQQVILDVKRAYFRVLQSKEFVALAKKNLDSSAEHLRTAKNMLDVGVRSRTDVLRWEVQKAGNEGDLVEAENNLEISFAALKQAMGVSYERNFDIEPIAATPEPPSRNLDQPLPELISRHPKLKSLEAALDGQRAGVRLASSAIQPKVNFVYQLGWEENNTVALDSFSFWRAGISLHLPIFHSFKNFAGMQEAKAELNRLEETKRKAQSALKLQMIRARRSVEAAIKRFQIAQKAAEQASDNLRILNNTYSVGLASNLNVLDAELVYTKAQTEFINTRYDYWIARAALDRSMGLLTE